MEAELLPCPFCNALDDIAIRENCTSPVMGRPPNIISVDITHWCRGDGLPRCRINITGATRQEAINTWNRVKN